MTPTKTLMLTAILVIASLSSCADSRTPARPQSASDSSGPAANPEPGTASDPNDHEASMQQSRVVPDGVDEQATVRQESSPSQVSTIKEEVARLVPNDAVVRMEKKGDLDGDGYPDVLLVLRKSGQSESAPRELVLLRGTTNGTLEKSFESENAILCQSCGGMMGDPLVDVTIKDGGFTLIFEGGSREMWSREYDFKYSKNDHDWYLMFMTEKILDRISGRQESHRRERKQLGSVSIKDFDASLMAMDSEI